MRIARMLTGLAVLTLAVLPSLTLSCSSDDSVEESGPNIPAGSKFERDGFTVVHLHGTPYEMGYQHGTLLHAQLDEAAVFLKTDAMFKILADAARLAGLEQIALDNSYPEMIEECQGLIDAVKNPDLQMAECLLVNFGDVAVEFLQHGMPEVKDLAPGCSQMVATGDATTDGRLLHARVLDWFGVDFVVNNPVIFVREPKDGIAHAFIGFPANLSSYQGINAEGISVASNEVDPLNPKVHDLTGRSHVQMVVDILTHARSLDDARSIVTSANHMTLETLVVSDGKNRTAEVYELSPQQVGIRKLEDGVVWATNHFIAPNTDPLDEEPRGGSTSLRFERLNQLLRPESAETRYGGIDAAALCSIMRDRINPDTGVESPPDEIDDSQSIATNGALYMVVFDPEALSFWVAAGKLPVPKQPFVGFNLGEMLGMEGYETPATMP